jgi:hypothetical protein
MRFAIFSQSAPPDWLIVSIATLSTLTAIRLSTLTKSVITHLLESKPGAAPADDVKFPANLGLSPHELKGVFAAVSFIVTEICRTTASTGSSESLDETTVVEELRQLGLQSDLASAFGKKVFERMDALVAWTRNDMAFRHSKLTQVDGKVFVNVASGSWSPSGGATGTPGNNELTVSLKLDVSDHKSSNTSNRVLNMSMDLEQFDTLKMELEGVRAVMDKIDA